ncbi:hypothetical protein M3700_07865 [Micrococcus luteus]|nr:hypothetical protein [Micrococcus luteus]
MSQGYSVAGHHADLLEGMRACLTASESSELNLIGALHVAEHDFSDWVRHVPEVHRHQMTLAQRELALATHFAVTGLYRQAFANLRVFLELEMATLYFSMYEMSRREWMQDKFDFSWSRGMKDPSGLLGDQFVSAFCPTLAIPAAEYRTRAWQVYRTCSQFIHGKARQSELIPKQLEIDTHLLQRFSQEALYAADVCMFVMLCRFWGDGSGLPTALLESIEARFGHIVEIRKIIGLTVD